MRISITTSSLDGGPDDPFIQMAVDNLRRAAKEYKDG